ncbi:GNAT family N-acetyltransferase [Nocardioides cynanchi]|uniref:GNAT family N-acetyltransferase n=1 Tax=Nocardioides cynanchi TaxID=2558918 RepID=UPI001247D4F7|nr:GNAT family N-acetyltransferase [Nocardioides cynanchi]
MGERPPLFLGLLADHPELIAEVGVLRWREWGNGSPTPGSWIEVTAREAGSEHLPVTLVAMDLDGYALGAVALGEYDDALDADERAGRGPWLLGMVVRRPERKCGVGRLMVAAIEDLARSRGHERVWVATGAEAVEFYERCGWQVDEHLVLAKDHLPTTILTRRVATA